MLPIFKILILLALAVIAVLFVTSRNPTPLSEEQYAKYSGIIRILVIIAIVASSIKLFF